LAGRAVERVSPDGERVAVELDDGARRYDHVLLGTGYRIDIAKLGVLAPELLAGIACRSGSPVLAAGCESSVPGLHFVGASAVGSHGPLMRFIAGSRYAARSVTRSALAARRWGRRGSYGGIAAGPAPRVASDLGMGPAE
jgi:hypothetical protein